MLTNPSTLGLFEQRIGELLDAVHAAGALAYMDGANMNAILGKFKPGEAGFDVMHFNTHKTFSHAARRGRAGRRTGRGGRQARAVPALAARPARGRRHVPARARGRAADVDRPRALASRAAPASSSARTRISVRTAARPARGQRGRRARRQLPASTRLAGRTTCRSSGPASTSSSRRATSIKKRTGVRTLDIAKRLIDYGFHPPTIYFPLTVDECMLIEPTETESVETLDAFADALIAIAAEADDDPELVTDAPHDAPVRRLDEATAARQPDLRWRPMTGRRDALPGLAAPDARDGAPERHRWVMDLTAPSGFLWIVRGQRTDLNVLPPWLASDVPEKGRLDQGNAIRGRTASRTFEGAIPPVAGDIGYAPVFGGQFMHKRFFGIAASGAIIVAACGGATASLGAPGRRPGAAPQPSASTARRSAARPSRRSRWSWTLTSRAACPTPRTTSRRPRRSSSCTTRSTVRQHPHAAAEPVGRPRRRQPDDGKMWTDQAQAGRQVP